MALSRDDPRIAFICEQEDRFASLRRQYVLCFYYKDGSIDIRDVKSGKLMLKREMSNFSRKDFYIGATLLIRGRATLITDYADDVSRQLCAESGESTVVIVSEDAFPVLGRYISMLTEECNFIIANVQMIWITSSLVNTYNLPSELHNKRAVLVRSVRHDAINKAYDFVERAPGTCTAQDAKQAELWNQLCTFASLHKVAVFDEPRSTIVIVKPHIISSNRAGVVLQQLLDAELEPTALSQINLTSKMVMELLSMYKGTWENLSSISDGFIGNAWVVQFMQYTSTNTNNVVSSNNTDDERKDNEEYIDYTWNRGNDTCSNTYGNKIRDKTHIVSKVRMLCGPYETKIAQKLFPESIRARFGVNTIYNAIHCCDLQTDGPMYAQFFLKNDENPVNVNVSKKV